MYLALDVGSTSACMAIAKGDGTVKVIEDLNGFRTTPVCVSFPEDDDVMYGLPAKQNLVRNTLHTITCAKRLLGKSLAEVDAAERKKWECPLVDVDGKVHFQVTIAGKTTTYSPSDIMTMVVKDMKAAAEFYAGSKFEEAVLTYPHSATPEQLKLLKEMVENAGLKVMRLVSEPTAAIMGSDYVSDFKSSTIVVYNVGAYSTTATLVGNYNGMFRILDEVVDNTNGSQSLSVKLMQYCAGNFARKTKLNITTSKRAIAKLRHECERVMSVLSTSLKTHITIESLMDGMDLHSNIDRTTFEALCKDQVDILIKPLSTLIKKNNNMEVDRIILSGAGTKIPAILCKITDDYEEVELDNKIAPEEIACLGAAKQAALLDAFEDHASNLDYAEVDSLCKTISVVNAKGKCVPIFKRYTPVPARTHIPYESTSPFLIRVYEGESSDPKENTLVKEVAVKDIGDQSKFSVSLYINHAGSFRTTVVGSQDGKHYADVTVTHA